MVKENSITFEQFILELGIQRKKEGVVTKILPRYVYLNRALDILLKNPKVSIEEVYRIIAHEENTSEENVEKKMQLAIQQIFSRREQKEKFIEVFGNEKLSDIEEFLIKIITAYQNS